ncbi:hypothetical protein RNC47_09405 [Streptomyces sp. DSM 44918]|uniref:Uncharacterized protein n=1 Tax=Streptomyces millisiae TaxID=3075542 RepID=A0ABU2LLS9_9ACTN|nr:hypothetical protein [Streptomyces sp. DSM 44918]MDT0318550.1 hypothetical protein [Streptomyces sp. DSM 44918]
MTIVIVVQLDRVRVAQWAQAAGGRGRGGETVTAEQVQVAVLERGEPGDVLVPDLVAPRLQLGDGGDGPLTGPAPTEPAVFDGAEVVDGYAVLRRETAYGGLFWSCATAMAVRSS